MQVAAEEVADHHAGRHLEQQVHPQAQAEGGQRQALAAARYAAQAAAIDSGARVENGRQARQNQTRGVVWAAVRAKGVNKHGSDTSTFPAGGEGKDKGG